MKRRLFIDMDGVLAKWQDSSLEEVTSTGYFASREPAENVIEAIRQLILFSTGLEVYVLSAVFQDNHSLSEKNEWLDRFLGELNNSKRIFVPYGMSKSKYLEKVMGLEATDILIDDFTKNLNEWHAVGIKLLNGINNTKKTWKGYMINGLSDAKIIENAIEGIALVA